MNILVTGDNAYSEAVKYHLGVKFGPGEQPFDVVWATTNQVPPDTQPGTLVILSAPEPPGTCARFEAAFPHLSFAVVIENVRTLHAKCDFQYQPFAVVGMRTAPKPHWDLIENLLAPFAQRILHMTPESAELTKLALNTLLALQVTYGNEIGRIAAECGADPHDVVRALRADPRVGAAYIEPGGPPGEHLMRDVHQLRAMGAEGLVKSL